MGHCIQCSWNLKSYFLLKTQIINSRHWKDWCWSWNSNILALWCKELTHWNWLIPWCWERLRAGGEGDNRGWDGWMASPTRRTWVWVNSRSWRWIGRPGVLRSMGSQRAGHNWATELNWQVESKIQHKWTYLRNKNMPTGINRLMVAKGEGLGEGRIGSLVLADASYHIKDE